MLETYAKLGIQTIVDEKNDTITVPSKQSRQIEKTIKGDIMTIRAQPWPMLPMDIIHTFAVTALACE